MRLKNVMNNPYVALLRDKVSITITFEPEDRAAVNRLREELFNLRNSDIDIEVKKHRDKRSLDANNYMWVLCDRISDAIKTTKTEVYKRAIREVGVFHDMAVMESDVEEVQRVWAKNGIGWFTDVFDSKIGGCKRMRFYHGSSLYDSKQMARLIDYIVDEASSLGIQTLSDEELALMSEMWGGD